MRRETCLYCEEKGKVTQLVPVGHWGVCPICSAGYLARATAALSVAGLLAEQGMAPTLQSKGRPTRNGVVE